MVRYEEAGALRAAERARDGDAIAERACDGGETAEHARDGGTTAAQRRSDHSTRWTPQGRGWTRGRSSGSGAGFGRVGRMTVPWCLERLVASLSVSSEEEGPCRTEEESPRQTRTNFGPIAPVPRPPVSRALSLEAARRPRAPSAAETPRLAAAAGYRGCAIIATPRRASTKTKPHERTFFYLVEALVAGAVCVDDERADLTVHRIDGRGRQLL